MFIAISEFGFEPTELRIQLITYFYPEVFPTVYAMKQIWINYVSNKCVQGELWTPDGLNDSGVATNPAGGPFEEFTNKNNIII